MMSKSLVNAAPSHLPYLPMWIEGETLYSWAARFHELQGRLSSRQTGMLLFGCGNAATRYVVPSGIAHFVALTRGQLGSLSEILMRRTALRELRPFNSFASWRHVLEYFLEDTNCDNSQPVARHRIGGIEKPYALRCCTECIKAELAELGISYWHVKHQLQCSLTCLRHQRPLEFPVQRRTTWFLPHYDKHEGETAPVSDRSLSSALLLTRLSEVCTKLNWIHLPTFADSATRNLLALDIATIVPRRCGDALSAWFSQTQTSQVARAYCPNNSDLISGKWIIKLLRGRRSTQPIYWLLLWAAILENLPEDIALNNFELAATSKVASAESVNLWAELSKNMLYRFLHARRRTSRREKGEEHATQTN